jgi:CheY-like chemotaxis protein
VIGWLKFWWSTTTLTPASFWRHAFERAGHEVSEAPDGSAALTAIAVSRPALVVTDMMMPVMGGVELIRRLRADPGTADIPIVCVSGNSDLAAGADGPWTSSVTCPI